MSHLVCSCILLAPFYFPLSESLSCTVLKFLYHDTELGFTDYSDILQYVGSPFMVVRSLNLSDTFLLYNLSLTVRGAHINLVMSYNQESTSSLVILK